METGFRLLVLVPHRDARLPLRAWSASLFANGLAGAWSFPWVAPLARLNRPLSTAELKSLAHSLRRLGTREWGVGSGENRGEVSPPLSGGDPRNAPVLRSPLTTVWRPSLHIELSDDFFMPAAKALDCRITPLVLGSALAQGPLPDGLSSPPQVSFRAAALANMDCRLQPLDGGEGGFFFEWEIGPLRWLPKFSSCTAA